MPITDPYDGPGLNYTRDSKGEPLHTAKKYIVIHNTSNPHDASARDEASYAKRRPDGVSSHFYADVVGVLQSLDTDWRAQHAGSKAGNDGGISYEITGKNHYSRDWWLANVNWAILARSIAASCRNHRIEPQTLDLIQVKAGTVTGIITHDQARQAWGGTDHTDPGPGFPLDHLINLVRYELNPPLPPAPPTVPEPPLPPPPPTVPPAPPLPPAPPTAPPPADCGPVLPPDWQNIPAGTLLKLLWRALTGRRSP
jgi:hypothetical protein